MPPLDDERREIADRVRRELAIENALTPTQARLFVRCLQTAWHVPTIQWADRESRGQLDDARRLMHAADVFRQLDGDTSAGATECYRRAGELLEWLSRARDDVRTIAPVALYAAGCYQLGGLPAMAASLLQQAGLVDGEGRLYAEFLRADFDAVLRTCTDFWQRHPALTGRTGSADVLAEEVDDRVAWYLVVELVRSLGLIADSLRRGDASRLAQARQKLDGLEKLTARSISEDAWLLVAMLRTIAGRYAAASLYSRALRLADQSPALAVRLRSFAREQFARGRGILWTSQIHGLDRLISHSSFALCTPTGSGKTLIATLALLKELLLSPNEGLGPLALYLVPSRALAGEVEGKLTGELGRVGNFIITGLYGGADWGITDYWLTAERPTVLVATVEKADALMRYLGPMLLARLHLLIIDEAHQVVTETDDRARASFADHSNRSMRLEAFVSRILALKQDVIRIALTAVAGGAAGPVARWVEGRSDAEPVGTRYRSTRQLIGVLQAIPGHPGRIVLDLMNGRPLYVRGRREDAVYLPLRIPAMPQLPAAARNSLNHYNEVHVLWTALHLREGGRRILISVAQEPEVTMRWYADALALKGWEEVASFSEPENEFLRVRFRETREACIDYCGIGSYELALLDRGIATNHGQMPQRLRRLMTDLVDRRVCPIALATATLTEGVNLPFDLIFVTSLTRSTYDQVLQQPIVAPLPVSEFLNLAGRAGRPGAADGMEGMTLVALPQRPSTTAAGPLNVQRRQVQALNQDYEFLLDRLAAEERQQPTVASPLALLLDTLRRRATEVLGLKSEDAFLTWLESAVPEAVTTVAGTATTTPSARLADSLDELDSVLLAAVEEVHRVENQTLDGPATEAFLVNLWSRTFARFAAAQEAWLERAFIRRGRAIVDRIYPNAAQRRRLYQYGFAPYVGRRFDATAPAIRAELQAANDYGVRNSVDRIASFRRIGDLLVVDPGFGFRVRDTNADRALFKSWPDVLSWWMQAPGAAGPEPSRLRSWQRFVADNLEFRLGVAIGAVVAQAWSEGAADPLATPSLAMWRDTTKLPWFAFWARELLRWGLSIPLLLLLSRKAWLEPATKLRSDGQRSRNGSCKRLLNRLPTI